MITAIGLVALGWAAVSAVTAVIVGRLLAALADNYPEYVPDEEEA